ncbi:MAG: DUF4837 family protein [Alistipes sp.]|nr:DUF4837 family protein [Alistipes sp.]
MKRILYLFVALVLTIVAVGCTVKTKTPTKSSVGEPYDVMVVCDDVAWRGDLSMAVCDLLEEDAAGLTRPEGYFDIVRQVSHAAITDYERKYGNILIINTNAAGEPTVELVRNRYASPQLIVVLNAPSAEVATEYIETHTDELRELFEAKERTQSNSYYAARPADQLMADFKQHTGIDMLIPYGYYKATTRDKELLWYIRDYKNKAQYIFAYSYAATDPKEDLTAKWLMLSLDNRLATISSKGAVGSYMGVNENGPAVVRDLTINGREWVELRGWWEVNNDFMGGPFVSYSTYDASTNEITTIMFALYAPEDRQRNLLRELEHLIYSK